MTTVQDCVTSLASIVANHPMSAGKVMLAWRLAVGAGAARASHVKLDSRGYLAVKADDLHWQREFQRSRQLIEARLERLLGAETFKGIQVHT